jgi:hypothetical protein
VSTAAGTSFPFSQFKKQAKIAFVAIAMIFGILVHVAGCESLIYCHSEVFIWASLCCALLIVSGVSAIKCLIAQDSQISPQDPLVATFAISGALAVLCFLLVAGHLLRDHGDCRELQRPLLRMIEVFYCLQIGLVATFIACLFCLPKGFWRTHSKVSKDPALKAALNEIMNKLKDEEFAALRARLKPAQSSDRFGDFSDKVFRAIEYAKSRHDWYEDQRSRIFQIILGMSALAFTIAGFFLKNLPHFAPLFWSIGGLFLIILIALIAAVFHYNKELDSDRPYRSISDIIFWFFRYNLPMHSSAGQESQDILSRAQAVAEERRRFFQRTAESFDPHAAIRENLEQLFILQLLQRYKHESLRALRWLLSYSLLALLFQLSLCVWALWMAGPVCPPAAS